MVQPAVMSGQPTLTPEARPSPTTAEPALRELPLGGTRRSLRVPRPVRRLAVIVGLLALRQLASAVGWLSPQTLPSPLHTVATAAQMLHTGDLGPAMLTSLRRV